MDFPVTRETLVKAEAWVQEFAVAAGPAERIPVQGSFRWEHRNKDARAVQVAKAVRALSGLRAALHLADLGHTVECATLLRTVADFSAEIEYLAEGLIEGRLTDDQQRFVQQHFAPFPEDPDELAAREREYYVGRKDISKAHRRLIEKFGGPGELFTRVAAYLNRGYDSFVHGSNASAMELYTGRTSRFMLNGHESARHICMAKVSVAGKLKEFLNALDIMAMTRQTEAAHRDIRATYSRLDASKEDAGEPCLGLM